MRILVIHSRYSTGVASGENRVVSDEVDLLRTHGHDVDLWTPEPGATGLRGQALLGVRAIWSAPALRELQRRVERHRPAVVHAHNLFPLLSPAVLRSGPPPVVVTLHNYRLLCLPATFLRDGRTCEDCFGKVPWRGVVHRCYRGSTAGSAAVAASLSIHRALGSFRRPAAYLAVSEYVRARHVEAGFDPDRVWVKPNFVWDTEVRSGPGGDFVYLGRLSAEKGLDRLLGLWGDVPATLRVVGDGPDRARLQEAAPPNVVFHGSVGHERVPDLLRAARALVLPTICYEGAPRTVVEAYAAGVPVVASRIGAIPCVVDDGVTGALADVGDIPGWTDALRRLLDDGESRRLGANARRAWQDRYSPKSAIADLEGVYERAVALPGSQALHSSV